MATNLQRVQAYYCDALINATATQAQIDRLGTAFAIQAGRLAEYQAATATQKLRFFLDCARAVNINMLKSTEAASAGQAAANTAANNAETALPETP